MSALMDIAKGNPAMEELIANMNPPSQTEREGGLSRYVNAAQGMGQHPEVSPFATFLQGMTSSPNPFDPTQGMPAGVNAMVTWDQTQREAKQKGELLARKAEYDDMMRRQSDYDKELGILARTSARNNNTTRNSRTLLNSVNTATENYMKQYGPQLDPDEYIQKRSEAQGKFMTEFLPAWAMENGIAPESLGALRSSFLQMMPVTPPAATATASTSSATDTIKTDAVKPDVVPTTQIQFPSLDGKMKFGVNVEGLPDDVKATIERNVKRYATNPNEGTLNALLTQLNPLGSERITSGAMPPEVAPTTAPVVPKASQVKAPIDANLERDLKEAQGKKDIEVSSANILAQNTEAGKGGMKMVQEGYKELSSTPVTLNQLDDALGAWYKSKDQFGKGAEFINNTKSVLQRTLGVNLFDESIPAQQIFNSIMGPQAAKLVRSTDASPAVAQIKMMRESLGSIENDPSAIPTLLANLRKAYQSTLTAHNKQVDALGENGKSYKIDVPPHIVKLGRNRKGELWAMMSDSTTRKMD